MYSDWEYVHTTHTSGGGVYAQSVHTDYGDRVIDRYVNINRYIDR